MCNDSLRAPARSRNQRFNLPPPAPLLVPEGDHDRYIRWRTLTTQCLALIMFAECDAAVCTFLPLDPRVFEITTSVCRSDQILNLKLPRSLNCARFRRSRNSTVGTLSYYIVQLSRRITSLQTDCRQRTSRSKVRTYGERMATLLFGLVALENSLS